MLYIRRAFCLPARTGVIAMVNGMLTVSQKINSIHATQLLAGVDHSHGASQPFVPQIDGLRYDYHKRVAITSWLTTRQNSSRKLIDPIISVSETHSIREAYLLTCSRT